MAITNDPLDEPRYPNPKPRISEQQLDIAAFKDILTTEKGKRALKCLSKFCLEDSDLFVIDSARKTDFNLGANSVIRYIRYMLKRKTEQKQETVIS